MDAVTIGLTVALGLNATILGLVPFTIKQYLAERHDWRTGVESRVQGVEKGVVTTSDCEKCHDETIRKFDEKTQKIDELYDLMIKGFRQSRAGDMVIAQALLVLCEDQSEKREDCRDVRRLYETLKTEIVFHEEVR